MLSVGREGIGPEVPCIINILREAVSAALAATCKLEGVACLDGSLYQLLTLLTKRHVLVCPAM